MRSSESKIRKKTKAIKEEYPIIENLVIEPAGYPLRGLSGLENFIPAVGNQELFNKYFSEMWEEELVSAGDFLYDDCLTPEYAYKVLNFSPEAKRGMICWDTKITLVSKPKKIEIPKVSFNDIAGNQEAKDKCKIIVKYLKKPKKFGDWAPKNILFFGPPGTGKTMTALALANETKVPISLIRATDLIGKYVGDGARRINEAYDKAKLFAPYILFIDELDAVGLNRSYQEIRGDVSEVVSALLSEMDGVSSKLGVITIGATNQPDLLDRAIKNRFEAEIEFKLPNLEERLQILELHSKKMPIPVNADLNSFAKKTEGFSGRELKEKLLKEALYSAILKNKKEISDDLLNNIYEKLKPKEKMIKDLYG